MSEAGFIALHGKATTVVIDCTEDSPALLYWGKKLCESTEWQGLKSLNEQQEAPASARREPRITLTPMTSEGFTGQTGLRAHRGKMESTIYCKIHHVNNESENRTVIASEDKQHGVLLTHTFELDPSNDVLRASTSIKNTSTHPLYVDFCSAPTFYIPSKYKHLLCFEGRWAKEFQQNHIECFNGVYLRENRKGRTSHDNFPGFILSDTPTDEHHGNCIGFHLGWSGNHRLCVESLLNGHNLAQMGELLLPGELCLNHNESYHSPTLYSTFSPRGLNGISHNFHGFVRQTLLSDLVTQRKRPVHFNTWEALYFDHDHSKLIRLVEEAAAIGAERFVLDDGWFNGRRDDTAGLGDWYVDQHIYPEGLNFLVDKVNAAGMEFGLWFEPEMVNPDSELYRTHPDWVLHAPGAPTVMARDQLALDLSKPQVCDFLFERIRELLETYNIAYIKWDMNRDIHQPMNDEGHPVIHRQTHALYDLITKIRRTFPHLEIESCSSGGARADYGILAHTDRIWTSDSNDALDRLSIQRGFSLFFPPEVMGAHVGPYDCHITGRKIDIATRASTAFFGHMGMEVNLLEMDQHEKSTLREAISLHKRYRSLLHSGHTQRFYTNAYSDSFAVFSADEKSAIFAYTDLTGHRTNQPSQYYFPGLIPSHTYQVTLLWPQNNAALSEWKTRIDGKHFRGDLLVTNGIQLPIIMPETSLLFVLEQQ